MDHHQHHKFWFFAAITGAVLLALTKPPSRAQAQSVNDSYPSAAASPISEASTGPGAESPDGAETVAIRPDTASAPVLSSVAPDDASGSASKDDAVLEIPQVINPPHAGTPDQSGNMQSAGGNGSDADAAQSDQTSGQTAADDDDLAATADQIGTLDDYENQQGGAPLGPVFFSPGIRIVQFPRLPGLNALSRQPVRIPMAASPVILPPTSSGPFPSTSPMLMGPRASPMGMTPRIGTLGAFSRGAPMGFHR